MLEVRRSAILIIALILVASVTGIGVYSTMLAFQTEATKGDDGNDEDYRVETSPKKIKPPIYYCTTGSEIQAAINKIGSSSGTIIIINDITLDATIWINRGGSYIIEGAGSSKIFMDEDFTQGVGFWI